MPETPLLPTTLDAATGECFDRFVATSRFAAYQQTRSWAAVAPRGSRHDFLFFLAGPANAPIGAAVIRRTRLPAGYWLATVQRGPIVHDPALLGPVLVELKRALTAAGCCSVQLAPRVRGRDLPVMAEAMRDAGFSPLPADRQPLHDATGIVWLDKPEDAILAGFKQRGRRQLRAAAKAGVTIRRAEGAADIAAYQRALDAFRAKHGTYDMSGLPDAAGQAALIAASGGAMLLAEQDGVVIGGHAFARQADEAIWLSLATTHDDPAVPRSYPLVWEAMRTARAMGCVGYDLAGMATDVPRDAGEANRMQFKTAFAPLPRVLPPMQVAALKPIIHNVLFGARQLYRASPLRRMSGAAHASG